MRKFLVCAVKGKTVMNDKELSYMLAIAREGSIQKAADALGKNPSSLSRAVHRVEEELDIVLFRRTPAGLVPTDEGKVYLTAADEILEMYSSLTPSNAG